MMLVMQVVMQGWIRMKLCWIRARKGEGAGLDGLVKDTKMVL